MLGKKVTTKGIFVHRKAVGALFRKKQGIRRSAPGWVPFVRGITIAEQELS